MNPTPPYKIEAIRKDLRAGVLSQAKIAKRLGVSRETVNRIKRRMDKATNVSPGS